MFHEETSAQFLSIPLCMGKEIIFNKLLIIQSATLRGTRCVYLFVYLSRSLPLSPASTVLFTHKLNSLGAEIARCGLVGGWLVIIFRGPQFQTCQVPDAQ